MLFSGNFKNVFNAQNFHQILMRILKKFVSSENNFETLFFLTPCIGPPLFKSPCRAEVDADQLPSFSKTIENFRFSSEEEENLVKMGRIIFDKKDKNFESFSISPQNLQKALDANDYETLAEVLLCGKYARRKKF